MSHCKANNFLLLITISSCFPHVILGSRCPLRRFFVQCLDANRTGTLLQQFEGHHIFLMKKNYLRASNEKHYMYIVGKCNSDTNTKALLKFFKTESRTFREKTRDFQRICFSQMKTLLLTCFIRS